MVYTERWCHGWKLPFAGGSPGTQTSAPLENSASPLPITCILGETEWGRCKLKKLQPVFFFFFAIWGKNNKKSLGGKSNNFKYLFFYIPVSVSVCFSVCECMRARWSFSLCRTLQWRVITGDLVSVPSVTDMWSQDKPALRERETEEGRDREVALHTRWAVVSVFWCFNVLCSGYNAVYADMYRIQGMPKLRVLRGSKQWGKFCLVMNYVFVYCSFFFFCQMTWHFSLQALFLMYLWSLFLILRKFHQLFFLCLACAMWVKLITLLHSKTKPLNLYWKGCLCTVVHCCREVDVVANCAFLAGNKSL